MYCLVITIFAAFVTKQIPYIMKLNKRIFLTFLVAFMGVGMINAQTSVKVSGIVTSADDGQPMIGVAVMNAQGAGVITSIDGDYSIEAAAGTKITFSSIGFLDHVVEVPDQATFKCDVVMQLETTALDDVVVVAYGVRKKGTIAGSVSTVKSDALADVPAASFDQALQGKAAGLMVLSNSGEPSAVATFQIRGTNSINSGTAPLFIMDGLPISSSDFNSISPNDIESISVLKDASSTSIYGARAANGVVVITTKRGQMARDAKVTFRTQLGFSQLANANWNQMNTAERIQYEKEVGLTAGKNYEQLSKIDVNWLDKVFNKYAPLQNYELQVSGATDRINYYVSTS